MSKEFVRLKVSFHPGLPERVRRYIESHALYIQGEGEHKTVLIHKTYALQAQNLALAAKMGGDVKRVE